MIQDIAPKVFDNQYRNLDADGKAYLIYAYRDMVLLKEENGTLTVPKICELDSILFQSVYLFSIDGQRIFMPCFQSREAEKEALEF